MTILLTMHNSSLGITPQTPRGMETPSVRSSVMATSMPDSMPVTPISYNESHIIETLNPHLMSKQASDLESVMNLDEDVKMKQSASHSRVALAIGTDPRTWNYRYMFEKPGVKSQALDDALEEIIKAILETYRLSRDDIADPSVTSQETVYVVGKVGTILNKDDKTPNLSDGMTIEASRTIGSGSRTPLRFSANVTMRGLPTQQEGTRLMHTGGNGRILGVFPGMVAGFRGRNGGGDAFVVEEVLLPPALPHAATNVHDMFKYQFSSQHLEGDSLQLQIASGPYTNDDNLDFAPWHRLMDQVEQQKPDVILLLGPFLSVHHSSLMDPHLGELPQDIFQKHISRRLNHLCELTSKTTAILLPSTKDIVSPHAAWPQPMFDKASLGLHKRVKCLPNPCLFSINEVVLGATTADVLKDIRGQEFVINCGIDDQVTNRDGQMDRDGISRTIRNLFHQRHFYPISPTPSDLPLDVTHSKLASFPSVTPDLLLLPSVLTPFARVVDATVVINPGPCAKGASQGASKGSFASIAIHPNDKQSLQDALEASEEAIVKLSHKVYERARVDVYKM